MLRLTAFDRRCAVDSTDTTELGVTLRLVKSAQAGDRQALDRLFARYLPRIRLIVAQRLGVSVRDLSVHEDIVQEALLKAFKGLAGFEPRSVGSFRNWAATCVESAIRDDWKRENAQKRGRGRVRRLADFGVESWSGLLFPNRDPSPSQIACGHEYEEQIESALFELKDRDRELIVLRQLCGLTDTEIAERFGIEREQTVRTACHRALKKLRRALEEREAGG